MLDFELYSPAFGDGTEIPRKHGYKYGNSSPPLGIRGVPEGCASMALIMDDPDAMGAVGRVESSQVDPTLRLKLKIGFNPE